MVLVAALPTLAIADVGTELGDLVAENLLDPQPSHVWKTDDTAPWVIVDAGATLSFSYAVMLYTDAASSLQCRWRADDSFSLLTSTPASASVDSGVVDVWPHAGLDGLPWAHHRHDFVTDQAARYWRFDVVGLSGGQTFRAARIALLDPVRVTRAVDPAPRPFYPVDEVEQLRSHSGDRLVRPRSVNRGGAYTIKGIAQSEALLLGILGDSLGRSREVFASANPGASTEHHFLHHGTLNSPLSPSPMATANALWEASLDVRGV